MTDEIMTIFIKAAISVLVILVNAVVVVAIAYINKKKEELIKKIGEDEYEKYFKIATDIFHYVEQNFKGVSSIPNEKRKVFEDLIKQKIPYITQEEIDYFRESVVGKINQEIKKSKLLEPSTLAITIPANVEIDGEAVAEQVINHMQNNEVKLE